MGFWQGCLSCAVNQVMIRKTKIYDAWLTDFVWWVRKYIRVAIWSATLVGLVIICSREYVKQNSKYDLVRWGISFLIVFVGLCLKMSLSLGSKFILMSPRKQHSWDSKTLVSLSVRSRQFTKSYLSGGLHKIPIRTGLDLGRKISIKIFSVLMQKLGFQLYET